MKKIYILLATLVLSISAFAQNSGNLIVFSEDGLKFYLVLNGIRQNESPLTNVKVVGLNQPYYSAKIIFEDTKQPNIEKKYLAITDADKNFQEVTYKIKRNNKLENVLRFFSQVAIEQAAPVNSNISVVNYNTEPLPEIGTNVNVGTQQITTQTTTNSGINGNVNIGINVPGINMNVNVNDPNMMQGSTTTTSYTTTTTTSSSSANYDNYSKPKVVGKPNVTSSTTNQQGCGGSMAMSATSFNAAKQTINKQSFDDTKLTTAKQILKTNCLSAAQIKEMMLLFSFEANRLELAKLGYNRCVDVNNYFLLNDAFSFDSSVEELNNSIK